MTANQKRCSESDRQAERKSKRRKIEETEVATDAMTPSALVSETKGVNGVNGLDSDEAETCSVLVVGAGPAGLMLA